MSQKKVYRKPELKIHGDLITITHACPPGKVLGSADANNCRYSSF